MKTFNEIAEFGKKLASLDNMDNTLELIAEEAKRLSGAERCSIFIVDDTDNILWTKLSNDIGRIVIGLDAGIVGDTYKKKEGQIVNNPYEDRRFLPNIDKQSGFITKNMLSIPIFNSKRDVMGVMQLLNKSRGDFDEKDLDILTFLANYISGSLELVLMNES
ncbi:GAF domain-containing protein [Sulfurimonas sp. SAG-AH-194-L11]|nr:GAF domain-containing protein [Sulfurimonas sp. SAG-AH-194-L11]MDF1876198.1 GAF domain-containing protein [Sulfurimonas sp. SAG-AH-194-L11]